MRHRNSHEDDRPASKGVTGLVQVTREGLLDDAFMAKVYAQLPADARLRMDDELEASIDGILSRHGRDAAVSGVRIRIADVESRCGAHGYAPCESPWLAPKLLPGLHYRARLA